MYLGFDDTRWYTQQFREHMHCHSPIQNEVVHRFCCNTHGLRSNTHHNTMTIIKTVRDTLDGFWNRWPELVNLEHISISFEILATNQCRWRGALVSRGATYYIPCSVPQVPLQEGSTQATWLGTVSRSACYTAQKIPNSQINLRHWSHVFLLQFFAHPLRNEKFASVRVYVHILLMCFWVRVALSFDSSKTIVPTNSFSVGIHRFRTAVNNQAG